MGLDDSIVSIGFIKADTVDLNRLGQCFSNFFFFFCIPLSQYQTCSRTSAATQNHVRIPLGTANINAYFQDTGLPGFPARWQVFFKSSNLPSSRTKTLWKPQISRLLLL